METKKQTAVEWLQEAMSKKLSSEIGPYFLDLFENAKAMEKEQILNAYGEGFSNGNRINFRNRNEYYTSTYE